MQILTQGHGLSVARACSSARLSRAAYYKPVADRSAADAEIIVALNELHAQHIGELERTIAGLHEVLRDLATAALQLLNVLPRDQANTVIVEDIVKRAGKVLAYFDPPRH